MIFFIYRILITLLEIVLYFPLRLLARERAVNPLNNDLFNQKSSVWFHAASLGEVNALKPLLKQFLHNHPKQRTVLTTVTATGQQAAKNISPLLEVGFVPIDLPSAVKRFYRKTRPELIVLMETEFWPQMLYLADKQGIPVIIINGRLSQKSLVSYRRSRHFWKIPWQAIKLINAQSEKDKARFMELGFEKVHDYGNLKFALHLPEVTPEAIRQKYQIKPDETVLTIGSSRPGEEALLLKIWPELSKKIPRLKLVIVPRHLKRIAEIQELLGKENYQLYSRQNSESEARILVIDQMGLLTELYAISNITITGGSFFDFGGHNPLEAAYYSKPVIIGEYHQSCADSVKKLEEHKAIIISSKEKLAENIIKLASSKKLRHNLGKRAKLVMIANRSSLHLNLKEIEQFIDNPPA